MGIFQDMYEARSVATDHDFKELQRMLTEAIERGHVREIAVTRSSLPGKIQLPPTERWFLDLETREIYSLTDPGERSCGYWERIDLDDVGSATHKFQ